MHYRERSHVPIAAICSLDHFVAAGMLSDQCKAWSLSIRVSRVRHRVDAQQPKAYAKYDHNRLGRLIAMPGMRNSSRQLTQKNSLKTMNLLCGYYLPTLG
jgi:hypothetical protein